MARLPSNTASGNGYARQPTWFTRGRLLLLALLVFILGGIAVALDLKFVTGGKPRPVLPNSLLVLGPKTLDTLQNLPGQEAPPHPPVVRGAGLVWTVDTDRNRLLGTNPESGRVVRNVVVGTGPVAVAIGFGSAWVPNSENGSITRVADRRIEGRGARPERPAVRDRDRRRLRLGDQQAQQEGAADRPEDQPDQQDRAAVASAARRGRTRRARAADDRRLVTETAQPQDP